MTFEFYSKLKIQNSKLLLPLFLVSGLLFAWDVSAAIISKPPSKLGKALNFDGSDDRVDAGSPASLDNVNTFTYTAWVKPIGRGETSAGRIVNKTGSADTVGKRFQSPD